MPYKNAYANLEAIEGSNNGANTLTLKRKSRQITLVNDSGSVDLQFKFNNSEDYATLQPTETLQMEIITNELYLNSTAACAYRLWVFG